MRLRTSAAASSRPASVSVSTGSDNWVRRSCEHRGVDRVWLGPCTDTTDTAKATASDRSLKKFRGLWQHDNSKWTVHAQTSRKKHEQ